MRLSADVVRIREKMAYLAFRQGWSLEEVQARLVRETHHTMASERIKSIYFAARTNKPIPEKTSFKMPKPEMVIPRIDELMEIGG